LDDCSQTLPQLGLAKQERKGGSSKILEPQTSSFEPLPRTLLRDPLEHWSGFCYGDAAATSISCSHEQP